MSGQIDIIVADLDDFCAEELSALALSIHENLVAATPIDIGWARAGWVPSVGQPYTGGLSENPTASDVAIMQARATTGQAEVLLYQLTDGDLFVTNNVEYIQALNDGWSKQAPSGFVQIAVTKSVREFER